MITFPFETKPQTNQTQTKSAERWYLYRASTKKHTCTYNKQF